MNQPPGLQREIVANAIPADERVWVPQAEGVWFRPLLLNTVSGGWCNLLRVRRAGVLSRHRHPMLVVGYVIKGAGYTRSTTGSRTKATSSTNRPAKPTRSRCRRTAPR